MEANHLNMQKEKIIKYAIWTLIFAFLFYAGTVSRYSEIIFITHSYLFAFIISIIFILFLIYTILLKRNINKETLNPLIYITIGTFIFLIFTSIVKCDSIFETYRIITPIALFLTMINTVESKEEWKLAVKQFLAFGVYMGILNYIYFYKETGFYGSALTSNWGYQNTFAAFLVLMSFLGFGIYLEEKDKNKKMLLSIIPIFFNFLLFLTISRGGYIAFTVATIVLLLSITKNRKTVIKESVPVIIGSIVLIAVGTPKDVILKNFGKEKLLVGFVGGNQNLSLWCRVHMAHLATIIFSKKPLTGFGLGTFRYTFAMYEWVAEPFRIDPHSLFFKLLAETGILGTVTFFTLIFNYLIKGFFLSRKNNDLIYIGLLSGISGMFFHILIDVDIYPIMFVILFFGLALLVPQKFIGYKTRYKNTAIVTILVLISLIIFNLFPKTVASIYAMRAEDPYMHKSIEQAVHFSKKAVDWDPHCAEFINSLANNISKENIQKQNAYPKEYLEKLYKKAFSLNRYDRRYPFNIGILLLYKSSPDSIQYFHKALKLYPTNPHTLAWIGVSYIYTEKNHKKAQFYINDAERYSTKHLSDDVIFAKAVLELFTGNSSTASKYLHMLSFYRNLKEVSNTKVKEYIKNRYALQLKIINKLAKNK